VCQPQRCPSVSHLLFSPMIIPKQLPLTSCSLLKSYLSFILLATAPHLLFSPMIMPPYTSVPGSMKKVPLDCSSPRACKVARPSAVATSTPVMGTNQNSNEEVARWQQGQLMRKRTLLPSSDQRERCCHQVIRDKGVATK
jgi:hypothetical protein